MFVPTENQIRDLAERGITLENFRDQIDKLRRGSKYLEILKPAEIHDGIMSVGKDNHKYYISLFSAMSKSGIAKFVPASGAASRMFSHLTKSPLNTANPEVIHFFEGLKRKNFAFTRTLENLIQRKNQSLWLKLEENRFHDIIKFVIGSEGLDYGNTPKGLILFHNYKDMGISPVEEHILEAYEVFGPGEVKIHLSISPEHKNNFINSYGKYRKQFKNKDIEFCLQFNFQLPSTDTVSVYNDESPVKQSNGTLYLRPGGHGSLLKNLNEIDEKMIFLKNIDNITTKDRLGTSVEYKKLLGGILIDTVEKISSYLKIIPRLKSDSETINDIYCYAKDILNINFNEDFLNLELQKKKEILLQELNRPVRICGMVENRGEPGGGPFWIKDGERSSLQIVEKSQIDFSDSSQKKIFYSSKYFNPVDIACWLYDYKGEKFDLNNFADHGKYIVSNKIYNGNEIRILEHPGLWNGMMNDWISIFVEVPLETFNPVKWVNDLLQSNHLPDPDIKFYE